MCNPIKNNRYTSKDMSKEDIINRLKELQPKQEMLNKYLEENKLSWQNQNDLVIPEVREAYEIWEEVRELGKILYDYI